MARNGYLAEDGIGLVTVEDNDQLIASAAASFLRMKGAAAADGVGLWIVEPAGAYRSAFVQNDMVDHPERYNLNPASVIKFGRSGQSHGWGNRVDVNPAALPWMLRNAARFGWVREYGARDPNHFKYDGSTSAGGAGGGGIDTTHGDEDMRLITNPGTGTTYWIGQQFISETYDAEETRALNEYNTLGAGIGISTPKNEADFWRVIRNHGIPQSVVQGTFPSVEKARRVWWWAPSTSGPVDVAGVREAARAGAAEAVSDIKFPTTLTIDLPATTGTLS